MLSLRQSLVGGGVVTTHPVKDYIIRYKMSHQSLARSINSPTFIAGTSKPDFNAISYNGVDEYTPQNQDAPKMVGIQGAFSVSVWVKPTADTTLLRAMMTYGTSASGGTGFQLVIPVGSLVPRYISGAAGFNGAALTANIWNHVVYTINGTSRKIYVNNGASTNNTNTTNTFSNTTNFYVASNTTGTSSFFLGGIDDITIWRRTLSDAEVALLYAYKV